MLAKLSMSTIRWHQREHQTSAQTLRSSDSTGVSNAKVNERAASKHCRRASPSSLPTLLLAAVILRTKAGISYGVEDMTSCVTCQKCKLRTECDN